MANGPVHAPDHTVKGVLSLPGVPEVRNSLAAGPYSFSSIFGSAIFSWTTGTCAFWLGGRTHSTLITGGALDARAPSAAACEARSCARSFCSANNAPLQISPNANRIPRIGVRQMRSEEHT